MAIISENIKRVQERIYKSTKKVGRKFEDVTLVCVTKTRSIEEIEQVLEYGIFDLGENYVQEAQQKFIEIGNTARWHMIGFWGEPGPGGQSQNPALSGPTALAYDWPFAAK